MPPMLRDVQWRLSNRCDAGFEHGSRTSGSAIAGSTPDRQRPFDLTKTGCPRALLPLMFWTVKKIVYDYLRRWSLQGV